jgi:P pilus assembly chaperone PapD
MTTMLGRGTAIVSCAVMLGWSAPVASGSEADTSDPRVPVSDPPTNSTSYRSVPSQFSLTVSPTRVVASQDDLGAVPPILVVNRGQAAVPVTVQKRNFTGGADGSMVFRKDAAYSAAEWVTVGPSSFVVAPGASQTVTATVTVGTSPEPGDHQVALVFLVPAGTNEANISINRGIAIPVYVTVSGPTDDSASLSDLDAPGFVTSGTVEVTAKVRNTGTVHRDFRDTTRLRLDVAGSAAAFPDFTVMRGATRDIRTTWDPPLMCVCHPAVSIVSADGTVKTVTIRVIVFPVHLLGTAIGVLLVLAAGFWVRRIRRTNAAGATARHRHA